jgi:hypothetical protein
MASLSVAGMDPSSRNWGIAGGTVCTVTGKLTIKSLRVVRSIETKGKQVRQSSSDLSMAKQLYEGVLPYMKARVICAEIPVGSQSSRASLCSGVCIGILGSLRNTSQFIEVSPTELKVASHGSKTATKKQMIAWAMKAHPEAPWPRKSNGEVLLGDAEHMADAVAAIYAGLATDQYKQLVQFLQGNEA